MRYIIITILLIWQCDKLSAQFPFESLPPAPIQEFNNWQLYDWLDSLGKIHETMTLYNLDSTSDSITIQLTSFKMKFDSSLIRIYRNKTQTQVFLEPRYFGGIYVMYEPIWICDFDGDGRKDIKIQIDAVGNGLASLNMRIIYLFQTEPGVFTKASFTTKYTNNRLERDFDNDGVYEIITNWVKQYDKHSFWTFNLYNFKKDRFINVNDKHDYPLMVQFLHRPNFVPTDKIPKEERLKFTEPEPFEVEIVKP